MEDPSRQQEKKKFFEFTEAVEQRVNDIGAQKRSSGRAADAVVRRLFQASSGDPTKVTDELWPGMTVGRGYTVHYARVPRLFADLELAHGDGRFPRLFRTLTKVDLLVLDDWGPDRLNSNQRRDLMEIVEDRYGAGSTLITSQLPTDTWHEVIGEPTFADAILDRVVHNAYRLALEGPSIRKIRAEEEAAVSAEATSTTTPAKATKGARK